MKKYIVILWHLAYWFFYSLIVLLVWAGARNKSQPAMMEGWEAFNTVMRIVFFSKFSLLTTWPGIIGFYVSYAVLFPVFLQRKRIATVIVLGIGTCVTAPVLIELFMKIRWPHFPGPWIAPGIGMAVICGIHGVLALVLRGFIHWYSDIRLKMEMQQKNHEMELALIHSKLNPHFLFNTINNIDVMIRKDATSASNYLNQLSDILRYMLYDNAGQKVKIEKELAYIAKYVALQKIRSSQPDFAVLEIDGSVPDIEIEPMLFVPFIENAFTHSETVAADRRVRIKFQFRPGELKFTCDNNFADRQLRATGESGLGMELIRRRLELIYGSKQQLDISSDGATFHVALAIRF